MFAWNTTAFKTADRVARRPQPELALSQVAHGIVAGTNVATPIGWRPVESVVAGDQVLTFDGGMETVVAVERLTVFPETHGESYEDWPLHVPAGALGNREDMVILAQQPIMLESDAAEAIYGDPFALVPAAALEDFRGIKRVEPEGIIEVVRLRFAKDEIVFCNVGGLFHCPATSDILGRIFGETVAPEYQVLPMAEAELIVACLENVRVDRRVCARH